MDNRVIGGWLICLAGTAVYLYGYFTAGHPPLIDWQAKTPHWIAIFLPNIESEIGMVIMVASYSLIYWPSRKK